MTGSLDDDAVLDAVGPRLKALRQQRGTTLDRLSGATGISASTLSRLENGQRRATLELLLPLARAYRVALDELVGAPATGDPRVHLTPVRRHGRTWIPLTRNPGGLQAFKHLIPVAPNPPHLEQGSHAGYEWLYVLRGRLRLALGSEDFVLGTGEAAEFDTRVPHGFGNVGDDVLELLLIFGEQGERMHLRARATGRSAAPRRTPAE